MLKMYTACSVAVLPMRDVTVEELNAMQIKKKKKRSHGNFILSKIMQPPQSSGKVAPFI